MLSPVVPIFSPFVEQARNDGAEVIGEIELGYRCCDRGTKFVCISGTNGKPPPRLLPESFLRPPESNVRAWQHRRTDNRALA